MSRKVYKKESGQKFIDYESIIFAEPLGDSRPEYLTEQDFKFACSANYKNGIFRNIRNKLVCGGLFYSKKTFFSKSIFLIGFFELLDLEFSVSERYEMICLLNYLSADCAELDDDFNACLGNMQSDASSSSSDSVVEVVLKEQKCETALDKSPCKCNCKSFFDCSCAKDNGKIDV